MVPFQILLTWGHEVHAVCPDKKAGDIVATRSTTSRATRRTPKSAATTSASTSPSPTSTPPKYDALVIPGGRAPEYLRLDQRVLDIVRAFADGQEADRGAFATARRFSPPPAWSRAAAARRYPAVKPELEAAGRIWDEPSPGLDNACVDGNFVTAAAWPAHPAWMRAFLKVLGTPGRRVDGR